MQYRPEIDGLRTIAVAPVILYHASPALAPGGFVGVDVFFVISGFLITSIIRDELAAGRFSLVGFYERRARRILPALFAMMAFTLTVAALVMTPAAFDQLGKSALAAVLFSSNIFFWQFGGDYFASTAEVMPLLHTWSLAVEEQFYIGFPLLLMALAALGRRPLPWIAAFSVLSFAVAVWGVAHKPTAAFYLLPARAWEMGLGAMLAYVPHAAGALGPRLRDAAALAGLALIAGAMALTSKAAMFPGVGALAPCVGAALVIWAARGGEGVAGGLLASRPMVAIGLRSYGLYLWHWPVMALMRDTLGTVTLSPAQILAALAATAVLSELCLRLIERPMRSPATAPRRLVFAGSAVGLAGFGAVAIAIVAADGAASRFDGELRRALSVMETRSGITSRCDEVAGATVLDPSCAVGVARAAPDFVIWGDSHAASLAAGLDAQAARSGLSGALVWMGGCPPILGQDGWSQRPQCRAVKDQVAERLATLPAGTTVFLHGRWLMPFGDDPAADRHADSARAMRDTVARLRAADLRVVVVGPAPEQGWHVPKRVILRDRLGVGLPPLMTADGYDRRYAGIEASLAAAAAEAGAEYVSPARALCGDVCLVEAGGELLFFDSHHLSPAGARLVAAAIARDVALVAPADRHAAAVDATATLAQLATR